MSEQANAPHGGEGEQVIDENDRIINSIQAKREKFIGQLIGDGHRFPADKEDRAALLSLMDGATRTALAGKKLKADEKAAVSQAQLIKNLAESVRIARSMESASRRAKGGKALDRELPQRDIKTVPGHTDTGVFPLNTAAIMNDSANAKLPD